MTRITLEEKWREQAECARREASELPPGPEREKRVKLARQLDTASHLNEWLSSPGLRPPTGK